MTSKVAAYLALTRPVNLLIGAASIFLGALLTNTLEPYPRVVLACLSGTLIMAGGNAINDYYDVDIDRLNKPHRALPAQRLRSSEAVNFTIILFVLGIFLSILINLLALGLATVATLGLVLYSARLKRTALAGNVLVSLLAALAFVYGAASVGRWQAALIPAAFAFLFHLGREIIKDVQDQEADAAGAAQTLPVRFGNRAAFAAVTIVFTLLILFTFIPYILKVYGKGYLWIVVLGVDLVLLGVIVQLWARPELKTLRHISTILKLDMVVGLVAIYVGQVA